eukprot:GDKH01000328.1.p3 GENE.GDKH01000328.1~~GDKH01000328.1.p3  ORF type:complete len:58 (-),score=5.97 GDKH01000328.1:49-222(-)
MRPSAAATVGMVVDHRRRLGCATAIRSLQRAAETRVHAARYEGACELHDALASAFHV